MSNVKVLSIIERLRYCECLLQRKNKLFSYEGYCNENEIIFQNIKEPYDYFRISRWELERKIKSGYFTIYGE